MVLYLLRSLRADDNKLRPIRADDIVFNAKGTGNLRFNNKKLTFRDVKLYL